MERSKHYCFVVVARWNHWAWWQRAWVRLAGRQQAPTEIHCGDTPQLLAARSMQQCKTINRVGERNGKATRWLPPKRLRTLRWPSFTPRAPLEDGSAGFLIASDDRCLTDLLPLCRQRRPRNQRPPARGRRDTARDLSDPGTRESQGMSSKRFAVAGRKLSLPTFERRYWTRVRNALGAR